VGPLASAAMCFRDSRVLRLIVLRSIRRQFIEPGARLFNPGPLGCVAPAGSSRAISLHMNEAL